MSRTVETSAGLIEVRSLTRKEIKAGSEYGLKYIGVKLGVENFDQVCDYCLGCAVKDESALDPLPNKELHKVFQAVIAETWGDKEEEKNSSTSGPSDQTEGEKTSATAVENPQ